VEFESPKPLSLSARYAPFQNALDRIDPLNVTCGFGQLNSALASQISGT
jgi:hypothetical protein